VPRKKKQEEAPVKAPAKRKTPEEILAAHLALAGYPPPKAQHRFHPTRRWAFDFAWPELMLAVEVEGGVGTRGRHVRPAGFIADCEKYTTAAAMGWAVLRYPVTKKGWEIEAAKQIIETIENGVT
jgi:very-short-patch-repair endonuclease